MYTKYNDFVGKRLNEENDPMAMGGGGGGGLLGGLKKLFGTLLKGISDDLKGPLNDLTKKLDSNKEKDPEKMQQTINEYLTKHATAMAKDMKTVKTPDQLKELVSNNLKVIYYTIQECVKFLGKENYNFKELFPSAPKVLDIFSKNEKKFEAGLPAFTTALLVGFGKKYGFDDKSFNTPAADQQKGEIDKAAGTTPAAEGTPEKGAETPTNASVFNNFNKSELVLEEADVPANDTKVVDPKTQAANLEKLKNEMIDWFKKTFYTSLKEKMVGNKKGPKEGVDANMITAKVDNKDGVVKMINKMVETKPDNQKAIIDYMNSLKTDHDFGVARDILTNLGYFKKEDIGTFKNV